jgi:hypothetical protein
MAGCRQRGLPVFVLASRQTEEKKSIIPSTSAKALADDDKAPILNLT